jgi:hypothetical protein
VSARQNVNDSLTGRAFREAGDQPEGDRHPREDNSTSTVVPKSAGSDDGALADACKEGSSGHTTRIPRRRGEELRIGVAEYRGRTYADVRSYYVDDDDEWRPGRGITVPPKLWSAFCAAVVELDGHLRASGIVTNEEGSADAT